MNDPDCLDQAAHQVITEGRYAIEPSAAVRDRVQQRVLLRLGAGAATLLSAKTVWGVIGKWAAGAAVVGAALGGGLYWLAAPQQVEVAANTRPIADAGVDTSVRAIEGAEVAPARDEAALQTVPSAHPVASRPSGAVSVTPSRRSDLAAEIELLAQANAALNRRDGNRARQLLSDYDRKFGAGVLREERFAAEILVLCATGDAARARAVAAQFEKRWPRSPLKVRVEASCARSQ